MSVKAPDYRELEHTADWELEVWAPDLPGLLEQAARGMYALAGVELQNGPRHLPGLSIEADDGEGLLVAFLSELLHLGETERLAFTIWRSRSRVNGLRGQVEGAPLVQLAKEIKAVTYHSLRIQEPQTG